MNRLQKKCFFAAAGFHLLLVLILLIGPAFLSSNSKHEDVQQLKIIPSILFDQGPSGGGNPNAAPPASASPAQPKPTVTPPAQPPVVEKTSTPEPPPKEKVKEVALPKAETPTLEPAKNSKPKIIVSTTPVIRKPNAANDAKAAKAAADDKAKEAADARARTLAAINKASTNIRNGLSQGTKIEMDFGSGGGGPSYGNYKQAILGAYDRVWDAPEGIAGNEASVTVSVTIARDGTVISARIIRPSGDAQMDASVRRALDRVSFIAPFPDGATDRQRTFEFDLRSRNKLSIG
jgi:TonB family protein